MKFDVIRAIVADTPFMEPERAEYLYNFILQHELHDCLELGFAHGVSSCYIAAALDEMGEGHLTSVDILAGLEWQHPCIEEMLARVGLERYVTVVREQTSYTWFLKKAIEANTVGIVCQPVWDFCYIDGPKNWTIDGCAFFLADKLLRQGGWFLFDDLTWSYALTQRAVLDGITIRELGEDERNTPQVELVFRLLVMQHPDYGNFHIQDDWWAWAQKQRAAEKHLLRETTLAPPPAPARPLLVRIRRKIKRLLTAALSKA
jgi:predicted O-methyltransferase YrrM